MQDGNDRTMGCTKGGWPMSTAGTVASEEVPDEAFLVIEMSCAGEEHYSTEHETFYPTPKFTVLGKGRRGGWCGQGFEFGDV